MRLVAVLLPSALVVTAAAVVLPVASRAASGPDFDAVVSAVREHYSVRPEHIPMIGFVSLCAHVMTGGGVKGMKIAEFDHLPANPDPADLESLVRTTLGGSWQPFVTDRSRDGELNIIYVQPDGESMRMMIADYEHGELDLVRVEVNGERLAHWVKDPENSARHHDYGTSGHDAGQQGAAD
ncbi:MAG TPA: hypothetical protein VHX60_09135 [Acidobacteriaceae bacterium]|jgi:hypothetical protein|nr:hypothetical protein [Acidobacteriaceae bacterium]